MTDITEMKELIAILMREKANLVENMFNERNFKLYAEEDKTKQMVTEMIDKRFSSIKKMVTDMR